MTILLLYFFQAVDPDLHKSLNWILANDITDVIDSTFSVEHDAFGAIRVHELKPGGKSIQVIHQILFTLLCESAGLLEPGGRPQGGN